MSAVMPAFLLRGMAALASPGGRRGRLSILIYHRVLPRADELSEGNVTALEFDAQMIALAATFSVLPLGEAVARLATASLPPRAACVTFDDGYADNAEIALPILQRHRIPATFFVATGYLDGGRMWNDTVIESIRAMPGAEIDLREWGLGIIGLHRSAGRAAAIRQILPALKYLPCAEREARVASLSGRAGISRESTLMMNTKHVRALHSAGMEIGAHSVTHPILAIASAEDATREIRESGQRLSEILRAPVSLFAYPNGKPGLDYGPEHVRMVREAGYSAAVSTSWGVATSATDRFQLPRFTPWDRSPGRFALRLLRNAVSAPSVSVPVT